jgi:hypothetical protein
MSLVALLVALLLIIFFNNRAGSEAAGCLAGVEAPDAGASDAVVSPPGG